MSPKQITRLGVIVAAISLVGAIAMFFLSSEVGLLNWWPAVGLGLAVVLFAASFIKGAYLTAQRRADMVDMLNDCYTGTTEKNSDMSLS